jgi:hypothetical protein
MKQPKRPTRAQKKVIEQHKLNPSNWFVERDTPAEMVIVHRGTGTVKVIRKGA